MKTINLKTIRSVLLLMVVIFLLNGCAGRVPGEVLDLSNTMGEDLKALHLSYRQLITTHFDSLRRQTDAFLQNQWMPTFIKDFIDRGNLVQLVQTPLANQRDADVTEWVVAAMEAVNQKRSQLMKPLDDEEKTLLEMVDSSFALLDQANSKIYAHLKSLSKLNEPMESALNIHDLKGLREKIDAGLATATSNTVGLLEKSGKTGGPEETGATIKEQNNN